jgi:O-antigen/teichoic acid export membrane protein
MLTKLKPKSEFSKNVLTLMTGTTIAQAIPIAISPILIRIYTPKEFLFFGYNTLNKMKEDI